MAGLVIHVTRIDGDTLERIAENAKAAWFGGRSHVRGVDRRSSGPTDQLIGQLGEYALAKFMGTPEAYFERRARINQTPWLGDDGSDLDGTRLDVKTTLMRGSPDPLRYNLLVRPAERHPDNIYILALVQQDLETYLVRLVGYAHDDELPTSPMPSGRFAGAYRLPTARLHCVSALRPERAP